LYHDYHPVPHIFLDVLVKIKQLLNRKELGGTQYLIWKPVTFLTLWYKN